MRHQKEASQDRGRDSDLDDVPRQGGKERQMGMEMEVQFLRGDSEGLVNLASDPKMSLLASCIISQQAAGFEDRHGRPVVDLRQSECQTCHAPGFNTGWGYWKHTCGAAILTDGEKAEPCRAHSSAA